MTVVGKWLWRKQVHIYEDRGRFSIYILRELYRLLLNILTAVWIDGFGVLTWFWGLHILLNLYLSAHIIMGENKNDAHPDWRPASEMWQRHACALYLAPATSILSWALLYIIHIFNVYRPPRSVLQLLRNIMLAQTAFFVLTALICWKCRPTFFCNTA